MEYTVIGGKGIRGFIVKHIMEILGDCVFGEPIVAVEMIHAASLIVDDLPCMDNDKIRRNKESAFVKFGKHESILLAFHMVSESIRLITRGIYNRLNDVYDENSNQALMLLLRHSPIFGKFITGFRRISSLEKTLPEEEFYSKAIEKFKKTSDFTNAKIEGKEVIAKSHVKLMEEWCDLLGNDLIFGQLLDLKSNIIDLFNEDLSKYDSTNEAIIKYKTCSLFSFAFILGAAFTRRYVDWTDFKSMGFHFGMMFQLVDDYKDREEDDQEINFFLKFGKAKTVQKYMKHRLILMNLLIKYKLCTPQFKDLITALDTYIVH